MTQIEKIKAEIERRVNAYQKNFDKADNKIARLSTDGRIASLKSLLTFINSLQAEPMSEDLELASERYACKFSSSKYGHDKVKDAVVWGANWQKEQMLKDAVDCLVGIEYGHKILQHPSYIGYAILSLPEGRLDECEAGDKVKLIIIKED